MGIIGEARGVPQSWGEWLYGKMATPIEWLGNWGRENVQPIDWQGEPFDIAAGIVGNAVPFLADAMMTPMGEKLREASEGMPITNDAGVFPPDSPLSFLNKRGNERAAAIIDAATLFAPIASKGLRAAHETARAIPQIAMEAYGPQNTASWIFGPADRIRPPGIIARANKMIERGADRDELWQKTLTFVDDATGRLMSEIDDSGARQMVRPPKPSESWDVPAHKYYRHPKLYRAFPELKDTPVKIDAAPQGSAAWAAAPDIKNSWVDVGLYGDKAVTTHEFNHGVQQAADLPFGGGPDLAWLDPQLMPKAISSFEQLWNDTAKMLGNTGNALYAGVNTGDDLRRVLDEKAPELLAELNQHLIKVAANRTYLSMHGEAWARLAAERANWPMTARKAKHPLDHMDEMLRREGLGGANDLVVRYLGNKGATQGAPTIGDVESAQVIGALPAKSTAITVEDYPRAGGILKTPNQQYPVAPVSHPPGITMTATHWTDQQGLDAILAGKRGSHGLWGAENNRLTGPIGSEVSPRSYWYAGGPGDVTPESGLGPISYTIDMPGVYDLSRDPDGLYAKAQEIVRSQWSRHHAARAAEGKASAEVSDTAMRGDVANLFEQMARDRGYRAIYDKNARQGGVITALEDVDLTGQMDTMQMRRAIEDAIASEGLPGAEQMGVVDEVGRAMQGPYERVQGGKTAGKYVGSPNDIKTHQGLAGLVQRLMRMAREGAPTAEWYARDAQNIANLSSGDLARGYPLADGIAITSPQTAVAGNAAEGLRAGYQGIVGDPFQAGRFSGTMADDLNRTMHDPTAELGRKRASFRGNLLQWWSDIIQGTTEDMQMARAAGFGKSSLSERQYDFLEKTVTKIADKLNAERKSLSDPWWTPERVQAAIWSAQKARKESRDVVEAGANLGDAMRDLNASVPFEARSNQVPALASGKGPANSLYHNDIDHLMTDRFGNNVIGREMGAYQTPQFRGQGVWGDERNPNTVMQVPAPNIRPKDVDAEMAGRGYGILEPLRDKKSGRIVGEKLVINKDATTAQRYIIARSKAQVDPSARKVLDATATETGGILKQEGAAWSRFTGGGAQYTQNAVRIEMTDFPRHELTRLADEVERLRVARGIESPIVVQPNRNGVDMYRPLMEGLDTEEGAAAAMAADKEARKVMQDALRKVLPEYKRSGLAEPKVTWGAMDGNYISDYEAARSAMPPELQKRGERVRELVGPAVKAHEDWINRHYGPGIVGNKVERAQTRK